MEVPFYCFCNPALEIFFRTPAELPLQLGSIDGVAFIVTRPIRDKTDSSPAGACRARRKLVKQVANGFDHMQIGALVAAANIVGLADHATLEHKGQGPGVVLDI